MAGTLVTLRDIALTFPQLPSPLVERPYLLEAIESALKSGSDLVLVEGEEQIGKTVLLAQFAIRHINRAFTLFIRSVNELGFDPRQVRFDLCNQINWYLRAQKLSPEADVSQADLKNLLLALQRSRSAREEPFYFIVDGLADIPSGASGIRDLILKSLPIGLDGFRAILSGSSRELGLETIRGLRPSTFRVVPFGLHEAEQLFSDIAIPPTTLEAIRDTCRGIPGRLAMVRRVLSSGCSVDEVLELLPNSAAEIFEKEWQATENLDRSQLLILACITFLPDAHYLSFLQEIVGHARDQIESLTSRLAFLQLDATRERIDFISDAFRRFAARKMVAFEREVWDIAVRSLSASPDSARSLTSLPAYLEKSGNVSSLAKYLTSNRLAASIRAIQSAPAALKFLEHTSSVFAKADLPLEATKFIVFKSALADLSESPVYISRTEAALALGRESFALTLSNAAPTEEQRLRLLVSVAKKRALEAREDSALVDQIKSLVGRIDFSGLDDIAISTAADLVAISPGLAGDVLKSYASGSSDPNALDHAFSRMALRAIRDGGVVGKGELLLKQVDQLASTESFKDLSTSAALAWTADNPDVVIDQLNKLSNIGERVFLGRLWVRSHATKEHASRVALELCNSILAETAYVPSATTFRDLALPLLHAKRASIPLRLFSVLEAQSETTKRSGPLVDHYRLRFLLFRSRFTLSEPVDWNILFGEAFEIERISDAASKAACAAWLLRTLDKVGDHDGLHEYVHGELEEALTRLLSETAEHDEAVRPVIRALVRPRFEQALSIASKLNTIERRDQAYFTILREMTRVDSSDRAIDHEELEKLSRVLSRIEGWQSKQMAYRKAALWLADKDTRLEAASDVLTLLDGWLELLADPEDRSEIRSVLLGSGKFNAVSAFDPASRFEALVREWESIEDRWTKLHSGYECVRSLASDTEQREHASELFERLESELAAEIDSIGAARPFSTLLLLAGRAYAGLTRNKLATDSDVDQLRRIGALVPGLSERARLLGFIAGYVARQNIEACKHFVQSEIRPLVNAAALANPGTSQTRRLVIELAPILWLAHPASALDLVRRLDSEAQEDAICNIIGFILEGRFPQDAWVAPVRRPTKILAEEDIVDALELIDRVETDYAIAAHLETIFNAFRSKKSAARLNPNQKVHLLNRITELSRSKFPDSKRITHEGYLVWSDANVLAIRQGTRPEWELLQKRVVNIPNKSDACYLSLLCSDLVPAKWSDLRKSLFEHGAQLLRSLPTYEDRLLRASTMIEHCAEAFPVETRQIVASVVNDAQGQGEMGASTRRERVIEMAHRIDEDWAASLVSSTDDDPVRAEMRHANERKRRELEIRRCISSTDWSVESTIDSGDLARACWKELGALNATGFTLRSARENLRLIEVAGKGPLAESYAPMAFATEAMVRKYSGTDQAVDLIRPLFSMFVEAANILNGVAVGDSRSRDTTRSMLESEPSTLGALDLIVGTNQRERALDAVRAWLRETRPDELSIVDPYFRPEDLDALLLIQEIVPDCQIRILTSRREQPGIGAGTDYSRLYADAWRMHVSLSAPPQTLICIAGTKRDGSLPIHDRWWTSGAAGLDFGTSWNSLGGTKASIIRAVRAREAGRRMDELEPFFRAKARGPDGTMYSFLNFTLDP